MREVDGDLSAILPGGWIRNIVCSLTLPCAVTVLLLLRMRASCVPFNAARRNKSTITICKEIFNKKWNMWHWKWSVWDIVFHKAQYAPNFNRINVGQCCFVPCIFFHALRSSILQAIYLLLNTFEWNLLNKTCLPDTSSITKRMLYKCK